MSEPAGPSIALLPWGNVIEDFLDGLDVSLETFCTQTSGGWLFGYAEALRSAGVRTVIFCVSKQVDSTMRFENEPTGATFCVLPASRSYLRLGRRMRDPYGWTVDDAFSRVPWASRPLLSLIKAIAPYLATPVRALMRELRRERCRAILCQEYEYARFDVCILVGRLLRVPVFATFQGGDWHLSRFEDVARPLTLKWCSGLIIAAQTEIDRVRRRYGVPDRKIARIFNPLDLREWQPEARGAARAALGIPASTKVVVWHGRVDVRRKGLDVLLGAWEHVTRTVDGDLLLLLVGTGVDAEELRRQLGSVEKVRWVDEYVLDRARVRRFLSAGDVYVLPSRHEGFPVAPIEAMACGLPVVATDAPGVVDVLGAGESAGGVIVPRGDASALGQALAALIADEDRVRTLGSRARERVRAGFATDAIGSRLRRFLSV